MADPNITILKLYLKVSIKYCYIKTFMHRCDVLSIMRVY
ncbi:hypothetical protein MTBBW1_2200002 [Desulfamplus magnetovallimortis]|uniref:Uncharacterized protein n=1 Tax=Desulfamplus magnetovallimortis TaxID=1246637 RepID=A0A1W1HD99_9BACT|nr:hypothetical protein MTBBW1_2200002 [Desulfamplus magnetovallimortis]